MEIAIIAHDGKRELMAQFCIAYYNTLVKHNLYAPAATASYVGDAAGITIESLLNADFGGEDQIAARVSYNEVDCLLYFRDADGLYGDEHGLLRLCDARSIPVATNIASAEIIVRAIEAGDLDWRNYINPKTNRKKPRRIEPNKKGRKRINDTKT